MMQTYMHACIHTYIPHKRARTHNQASIHPSTHIRMLTYMHILSMHTHIHMHAHTRKGSKWVLFCMLFVTLNNVGNALGISLSCLFETLEVALQIAPLIILPLVRVSLCPCLCLLCYHTRMHTHTVTTRCGRSCFRASSSTLTASPSSSTGLSTCLQ